MEVKEVTVGRTLNMGNYESLRIDLTATVGEGEDPREVVKQLDKEVLSLGKSAKKSWED